MSINKNIEFVRKKLIENNVTNTGDYEEFSKKLEKESNRKKIYDIAKGFGMKSDYNSFSESLGYPITPTEQTTIEPIADSTAVSNTPTDTISTTIDNQYATMSDEDLNTSLDVMRKAIDSKSREFDAKNPTLKQTVPVNTPYSGYAVQGAMAINRADSKDKAKAKDEYLSDDYAKYINSPEFKEYQKREREKIEAELRKLDELESNIKGELVTDQQGILTNTYSIEEATQKSQISSARDFYKKALKTLDAPSKYDDTWWLANMGRGIIDRATDADLYTLGINELLRNARLVPVARKLEEVKGKLDKELEKGKLTTDDAVKIMEDNFTEHEKALIKAYQYNEGISQKRANDISYGYRSGQGITDTGAFMIDFFLTGGISGGAKKAVKEGIEHVIKNKAGKVIGSALGTAAETAVRTAVLPHTYATVSNEMLNVDENTGKLNSTARAFALGMSEAFLTNLSETTGGTIPTATKAILKNKKVAKLTSDLYQKMGKTGEMLSNLKTKYDNSTFNKLGESLKKAGWHGTIDEWFEELDNAAFMYARGKVREWSGDKGAEGDLSQLPEFFTAENQKVLIPTLLAPGVVKGGISGVSSLTKKTPKLKEGYGTFTLNNKELSGTITYQEAINQDNNPERMPVFSYVDEEGNVKNIALQKSDLDKLDIVGDFNIDDSANLLDYEGIYDYFTSEGEVNEKGKSLGFERLQRGENIPNDRVIANIDGERIPLTLEQAYFYAKSLEEKQALERSNEDSSTPITETPAEESSIRQEELQRFSPEEEKLIESLEEEQEELPIEEEEENETPIVEPQQPSQNSSDNLEDMYDKFMEENGVSLLREATENGVSIYAKNSAEHSKEFKELVKKRFVEYLKDKGVQVNRENKTPIEEQRTTTVESTTPIEEPIAETPIEEKKEEVKKGVIDVLDDKDNITDFGREIGVIDYEDGKYFVKHPFYDMKIVVDKEGLKGAISAYYKRKEKEKRQAKAEAEAQRKAEVEAKAKSDAEAKLIEQLPEESTEEVDENTETPNEVVNKKGVRFIKGSIVVGDNTMSVEDYRKAQLGETEPTEERLLIDTIIKNGRHPNDMIANVQAKKDKLFNKVMEGDKKALKQLEEIEKELYAYKQAYEQIMQGLENKTEEPTNNETPIEETKPEVPANESKGNLEGTENNSNFVENNNENNDTTNSTTNSGNDTRGVQGMGFVGSQNGYIEEAKTIIKRGDGSTNQEEQRISDESEIDANRERQETAIEEWARLNNIWHEDATNELEDLYGEKIGNGAESFVYAKDNKTVIKARDITGYNNLLEALESIEIHNKLFPETTMTVTGFGRSDGEFTIIFEQPYISGEHPTRDEIEKYIRSKFNAQKDDAVTGGTSYKTNEYLLQDLKPQNVIVSEGKFYVIDGDFYRNPDAISIREESNIQQQEQLSQNETTSTQSLDTENQEAQLRNQRDSLLGELNSIIEARRAKGEKVDNGRGKKIGLNSIPKSLNFAELAQGENTTISNWYNKSIEELDERSIELSGEEYEQAEAELEAKREELERIKSIASEINGIDTKLKQIKLENDEKRKGNDFTPVENVGDFNVHIKGRNKRARLIGTKNDSDGVKYIYEVQGLKTPLTLTEEEREDKALPMIQLFTEEGDVVYSTYSSVDKITTDRINIFSPDGTLKKEKVPTTKLFLSKDENGVKQPIKATITLTDRTKQSPQELASAAYNKASNNSLYKTEAERIQGAINELEIEINLKNRADVASARQASEGSMDAIAANEFIRKLSEAVELLEIRRELTNEDVSNKELAKVGISTESVKEQPVENKQEEVKEEVVEESGEQESDNFIISKLSEYPSAQEAFKSLEEYQRERIASRLLDLHYKDGINAMNIPLSLLNKEDLQRVKEQLPQNPKGNLQKKRINAVCIALGEPAPYKLPKYATEEEMYYDPLVEPIVKWLKAAGIKVHATGESFTDGLLDVDSNTRLLKTDKGNIYGFVKNGEIYLDPEALNPNVAIHEYAHLWIEAMKTVNPELWKRGIEIAKELPEWQEVLNNPAYSDIHNNEEVMAEEVLAHYLGKNGASKLRELAERDDVAITLIQKVRAWIREFWSDVKSILEEWTGEDLSKVTVEHFQTSLLKDLSSMANITDIKEAESIRAITSGSLMEEYSDMRNDFISTIEEMRKNKDLSRYEVAKKKLNTAINFIKKRIAKESTLTKREFAKIENKLKYAITVYHNPYSKIVDKKALDRTADQLMSVLTDLDVLASVNLENRIDNLQADIDAKLDRAINGLQSEKLKKGGVMTEYFAKAILDAREKYNSAMENVKETIGDRIAELRDGVINNETSAELTALENQLNLIRVQEIEDTIRINEESILEAREFIAEHKEAKEKTEDKKVKADISKEIKRAESRKECLENTNALLQIEKVQHKALYLNGCRDIVDSGKSHYAMTTSKQEARNKEFIDKAIAEVKAEGLENKVKTYASTAEKVGFSVIDSLEATIRRITGDNTRDGRGFIYENILRKIVAVRDNFIGSLYNEHNTINKKVKEIFGIKRFEDLSQESANEIFGTVTQTVEENGEDKEISYDISQGTAMYIYMTAKQEEGKIALMNAGFSEAEIERISSNIPATYRQFADWIQTEYMPSLYEKYDETYYKNFFIHLPRVENYFPLKADGLNSMRDILANFEADATKFNARTSVDNLFHRTGHSTIDISNSDNNPNAVNILMSYVRQMEHWNNFVEVQRDANLLLNSKEFRDNILKQKFGATKWRSLVNGLITSVNDARIDQSDWSKAISMYLIGKIGFKPFTAIKQLFSYPAFFAYAYNWNVFGRLLLFNPFAYFKARKIFPSIRDRYENSVGGSDVLTREWDSSDTSYKWKKLSRWWRSTATWLNRTVDVMTVSNGALSIYEGMKSQYKKEGLSEQEADAKARIDALIAYKATQQENTPEFLSTIQRSGDAAATAIRAYQNASYAYSRFTYVECKLLIKALKKPTVYEVENLMKQEPNLTTAEAEKILVKRKKNQALRSIQALTSIGLSQFAWYLASSAPLLMTLYGYDDDESEEKILYEWIRIAANATVGTLANMIPLVGNMASSFISGDLENFQVASFLPDVGKNLVDAGVAFVKIFKEDEKSRYATEVVLNLLNALPVSLDMQTAVKFYRGVRGAIEDGELNNVDIANILQIPSSQILEMLEGDKSDPNYITSVNKIKKVLDEFYGEE